MVHRNGHQAMGDVVGYRKVGVELWMVGGLKAAMGYTGCGTIPAMQQDARPMSGRLGGDVDAD